MKKRFFAGLLACLMVVGLLPLSMLLKPVTAKAASEPYVIDPNTISSVGTGDDGTEFSDKTLDPKGYFKIYRKVSTSTTAWKGDTNSWNPTQNKPRCIQLGGTIAYKDGPQKAIEFTTKSNTNTSIKVWYYVSDINSRDLMLYELKDGKFTVLKEKNNEAIENQIKTIDPKDTSKKKAYIVKTFANLASDSTLYLGSKSSTVNIYRIEVTEETSEQPQPTETKYDVTVVDSATTETTGKVNSKSEGETFTLKAADPTNFLYWVNSYGRIVSRDAEYSFSVYYSDTYTAVYKSAETTYNFMTDYDQVYKTYTASDLAIPTSPVKYGYEFDYWKIGETKVSTVQEIKDAGTGTDVEIKPVYKEVTENVSITINGITKEYKKNKEVTADATGLEDFMYWYVSGDDGGESKILSYSSLYSFFADDKITSISAKCGTDTVKKSGIITHITNDVNGNNKTFVFEFTVPDDYKIEFAGIVASSTYADPNLTNYEYIRGRGSNAKTVRYSWTKTDAADKTWYVRPVLKYSDSEGNVTTIIADDVQSL